MPFKNLINHIIKNLINHIGKTKIDLYVTSYDLLEKMTPAASDSKWMPKNDAYRFLAQLDEYT